MDIFYTLLLVCFFLLLAKTTTLAIKSLYLLVVYHNRYYLVTLLLGEEIIQAYVPMLDLKNPTRKSFFEVGLKSGEHNFTFELKMKTEDHAKPIRFVEIKETSLEYIKNRPTLKRATAVLSEP